MDAPRFLLDLVRRLEVLVERLLSNTLLEEDGGHLDRLVVTEAGGLGVEGVEVGLVRLLERLLPVQGVLSLAGCLRIVDGAETKLLLFASEDVRLSLSLGYSAFDGELLVLPPPLRLLGRLVSLPNCPLGDLFPCFFINLGPLQGLLELQLPFLLTLSLALQQLLFRRQLLLRLLPLLQNCFFRALAQRLRDMGTLEPLSLPLTRPCHSFHQERPCLLWLP